MNKITNIVNYFHKKKTQSNLRTKLPNYNAGNNFKKYFLKSNNKINIKGVIIITEFISSDLYFLNLKNKDKNICQAFYNLFISYIIKQLIMGNTN